MTEILDLLWRFRSVQQRMILRDSLLTRQAGSVPSLQSLSIVQGRRAADPLNQQQPEETPLVDRDGRNLETIAR